MKKPYTLILGSLMAIIIGFSLLGIISKISEDSRIAQKESKLRAEISEVTEVDVTFADEISHYSRYGFHGDGITCIAYHFSDNGPGNTIKNSTLWNPFPLTDTLQMLVYGVVDDNLSVTPIIVDKDHKPLIPEIKEGYYFFIDRNANQQADNFWEHSSTNFVLALYDAEANNLYYCEFDT